ncbi:hypothetical protein [Halalkalibacter nanhaiisediminis]|uniref:Uncharacterized protein n=1 Tax=Halalkalibacter nanhaiisediminis TaxID=688079 RepID=A0A562QQD0_9BACI|nr:hypothetical protein [Halalkalibacter nanhaiisediminis]TWI58958.1 hypothetical protein IQ10_00667 [Halalkalibacter nanhaiisediminis]
MAREPEPDGTELKNKIEMMKEDKDQYMREAFIKVYVEYPEILEKEINNFI